MTKNSYDVLTYTHELVFTLLPTDYSRVIMNVIDHMYIGILPLSTHAIAPCCFSDFVTQQQRVYE